MTAPRGFIRGGRTALRNRTDIFCRRIVRVERLGQMSGTLHSIFRHSRAACYSGVHILAETCTSRRFFFFLSKTVSPIGGERPRVSSR